MLHVERMDKKPDARLNEIQLGWRTWASQNSYTKTEAINVEQNTMNVTLEIFESPTQKDRYLVYLPPIPSTVGGETLYIVTTQEQLTFMVDAVKKMVQVAMLMAQAKLKALNHRLN